MYFTPDLLKGRAALVTAAEIAAASREAAIAQCPLGRLAAIDDVANAAQAPPRP